MAVNEVKINSSSASMCKRCKRKVVNGVKCIDCESYFHNSCASFITNIKILDANTVKCRDVEEDNDCDEVFSNMLKGITDNEGKIDINIFKYIIRQKDCIIAELREKVKLLTQHAKLLTMVKDDCSSKQMKLDTSPKCDSNIKVVQTTNENPGASTVGSNSDPSNGSDINKVSFADVVKGRKMTGKQHQKLFFVIQVISKVPRNKVFFVRRFAPDVTESEINQYLRSHKLKPIKVTRLKTKHDSYASFQVEIDEQNFGSVFSAECWPEGCFVS
ncbi:hypothetical protein ANN_09528 [Periplaneta americana]|uniref:Phorbol-ester/DAG-type domain-containing protein n=1 Tax=Periplaneta americana TaxID=6978 RepID=A0ABQ8TLJ8_PERAM|nr:hypothetical protein ANN_09528 [Periplaneta americana]